MRIKKKKIKWEFQTLMGIEREHMVSCHILLPDRLSMPHPFNGQMFASFVNVFFFLDSNFSMSFIKYDGSCFFPFFLWLRNYWLNNYDSNFNKIKAILTCTIREYVLRWVSADHDEFKEINPYTRISYINRRTYMTINYNKNTIDFLTNLGKTFYLTRHSTHA